MSPGACGDEAGCRPGNALRPRWRREGGRMELRLSTAAPCANRVLRPRRHLEQEKLKAMKMQYSLQTKQIMRIVIPRPPIFAKVVTEF